MAHPQNSPRGLFAKQRIDFPAGESQLTYNSTGVIFSGAAYLNAVTGHYLTSNSTGIAATGAVYVGNAAGGKLTANSTTLTVAGKLALGAQATVGLLAANSTAILLPATGVQMASLTSLKITSNSTGIKIGSLYISCNSTGNTTT